MRGTCLLSVLFLSIGCAHADTLRVGTEAGFAPYIMRDSANALTGFDKDLMDAVCAEISAECIWSDVAFSSLIPSLMANGFDVIVGGLSATDERRRNIAFSTPYLESYGALVFVGQRYEMNPRNARIAVQADTTHEAYLQENEYEFTSYPTGLAAYESTKSGATDLVFGTEGNLEPIVFSSGNRLKIVQRVIPVSSGAAIGIHPDDKPLKTRIDSALNQFLNDGTIASLTALWFPVGERL